MPPVPPMAFCGASPADELVLELATQPVSLSWPLVPPPPELAALTVQLNEAVPLAPVVSLAVTVTDDVPAVVGVPEISPVEELIDSPAGRPVAL